MDFFGILYDMKNGKKVPYSKTYFDTLFAAKLEELGVKTITGTLPLTFTAKAGNAVDWVIYGNDDNGTENLFQTTATSSSGGGFIFAVNNDGSITVTGTPTLSTTYFFVLGQFSVPAGTYTITGCPNGGSWGGSNPQTYCSSVQVAGIGTLYETGDGVTVTAQSETTIKLIITLSTSLSNIDLTYKPMVVKGSTAPDHFIPYQKGVGERTVNKMPVPVNGVYSANRTTVTVTDGVYHIVQAEGSGSSSVYIDLPEFEVPDSGYINYLNSMAFGNSAVVLRYNGASLSGGYALTPINRAVAIGSDYAGKKVNQIQIYTAGSGAMDFTIAPMITYSDTYTTYIPYGYEIPISCEHTISDGISYNEDELLYFDGRVVRQPPYQTTSDFIAVTQKEITISGTSVLSSSKLVRLCGYDESKTFLEKQDSSLYGATEYSFTFALGSQVKYIKYSLYKTDINITAKESNGYTFYIGSSPLTSGQSISKTSTGVDLELSEGENTVSTTLYNKPTMTITYK